MAQELKKTETGAPAAGGYSDPFSAMRSEMDRVFDTFLGKRWGGFPSLAGNGESAIVMPSVDVRENDNEIIVEAEVPGMSEDDVDITLRDGVLTVKGEKKSEREEDKDDMHVTERSYGSFNRTFRLPDTVDEDKVTAALENGVLRVTLPKSPEAKAPEKKIAIGGK